MLNLRETIQAALEPRLSSYAELELWFQQNPRKCGNCALRTTRCPRTYIDVGRMVRVFPLTDNDPCPRWKPTPAYYQMDQAYVMAKMAHDFRS